MADYARQNRARIPEPEFLPPEPVRNRPAPQRRWQDVSDADFVVVAPGPVPSGLNDNQPSEPSIGRLLAILAGHLIMKATRAADRQLAALSGQAFATLTGLAALTVFTLVIGLGAASEPDPRQIVAAAVQAPALTIGAVSSHAEQANGLSLLVIRGEVTNNTANPLFVPPITVTTGSKTALIAPLQGELGPGARAAFTVRINQPGGKPDQIRLSFAHEAGSDKPL